MIDGTGEDKTITTWVLNPGLLAVDGNERHESWRREYSRTSKSQRKWQQSTGYGRQRHIIPVRVALSKQGTRVKIPLVEQAIQFRPNTKKLNFGTYIARYLDKISQLRKAPARKLMRTDPLIGKYVLNPGSINLLVSQAIIDAVVKKEI